MRRTITVTPGIAEALASIFTLRPHITAIGTADRDTSIIGIMAGIVIGKGMAWPPPGAARHQSHIVRRKKAPEDAGA
jgi:hypothetical protein